MYKYINFYRIFRIFINQMIRDSAIRNVRFWVVALYLMQCWSVYIFRKTHCATYEVSIDYFNTMLQTYLFKNIDLGMLIFSFPCMNLLWTIVVWYILWSISLLFKHYTAPILSFVATFLIITTHDNPFIYEGTKFDTSQVITQKVWAMCKHLVFFVFTLTIFMKPLEQKEKEN